MESDRNPGVFNLPDGVPGATAVAEIVPAVITPIADVTVTNVATLLRAANSARLSLSGTNNDGGVNIRIGDATVTAARGQRIGPGASFKTTVVAAVYAISEGANVTVSLTEETQV